jgi:hypothetical protein
MTSRVVLGDFLDRGRRELELAAESPGTAAPGRDAEEISGSLARLISVLDRYVDDLTGSFMTTREQHLAALNREARTAIQVGDALVSAAESVDGVAVAAEPASQMARRLDAAAASLTAGRDLLHTHFQYRQGFRHGASGWATVIVSAPMSRALLSEVAGLARLAAVAGGRAMPEGRPWPATALARRLEQACHWLSAASVAGHSPVPEDERDLLHAIPAAGLPPRRAPEGSETAAGLCAGIIAVSERVSHLAWTQAQVAPWSPEISVTSWRRIASAGTAASHHCHLLLTALAERARDLDQPSAPVLAQAADHAGLSRSAWLQAGRAFGGVTTDIRWQTSQAAAEAADLALWSGRLAFDNPAWRPSDGPRHPTRPPEAIALTAADLPGVVTAVHYAAEALEQLASSTNRQVRGAGRADRILMPARSLPDGPGTLGQFAPLPDDHLARLCVTCWDAARASGRAAASAGEAAMTARAPSRVLVTAREVSEPTRTPARRAITTTRADAQESLNTGPEAESLGPVETRLREIGVTSPRLLWRASGVDELARQVTTEAAARANRCRPGSAGERMCEGDGGWIRASLGPPCPDEPDLEAEP